MIRMPPALRDYRGHVGRRVALRDLNATFVVHEPNGWREVDALAEATGVYMLCPKCFTFNGGDVGTHRVLCWFRGRGVPDELQPGPGRWTPSGSCLDDLTFIPGAPPIAHSVLLTGGCGWHGYVRNGACESDT